MNEHSRTTQTPPMLASLPLQPLGSPDPALTPRLVVTDLDGSLLDHHSYDFFACSTLARTPETAGRAGDSGDQQNPCRTSDVA